MNWDKMLTFFGRLGGAIGGILAVCGFIVFMLKNEIIQEYLKEAVDTPTLSIQISALESSVQNTHDDIQALSENVKELTETFSSIQDLGALSTEPVLKFLEGSYITDGQLGRTVTFTMRFVKLRECGNAVLSAWFKNGIKAAHAFEAISIIDQTGKAIRAPADPGSIVERIWTARIPLNDGVTPGRAEGWVEVSYPDCPRVPVATSQLMTFEILDDDGSPVERER